MFGQPKPMASLSSGLLARKGQARPAMRPQGFNGFGPLSGGNLEDLGWNDHGHDAAPPVVTPAPETAPDEPQPLPPVLVQREALEEGLSVPTLPPETQPEHAPAPVPEPAFVVEEQETVAVTAAAAARIGRETAHAGKAAFTLRLDADRHLRLRLASAVRNRSAQQLVTAALDAFLKTVPEAEVLASQLHTKSTKR